MNKLLRAGFARMFKTKLFWLTSAAYAALAVLIRLAAYFGTDGGETAVPLDSGFFAAAAFCGIALAVFCSLFIGTEHSDGTIRNKLIVGHSRGAVYLSNLVICSVAGFIFTLVFWLVSLAVGLPLSGAFAAGAAPLLLSAALTLMLVVAYVSIFILVGMVCQSKAASAVIALLLAFVLLFMASYTYSRLNEPEYYEDYVYTENGMEVSDELVPNPNYLRGGKREVYAFFLDFLPGCQSMRIGGMYDPAAEPVFAAYSLIIAAAVTAAGMAIFKKKNIK